MENSKLSAKKKRDRDRLEVDENKLKEMRVEIEAAEKVVDGIRTTMAEKAAAEQAKAAAAAAKEEATRALSEAGQIMLCELRGKYSKQMDNTSDKVDSVWAHIHADFMKHVKSGDLPASDERSTATPLPSSNASTRMYIKTLPEVRKRQAWHSIYASFDDTYTASAAWEYAKQTVAAILIDATKQRKLHRYLLNALELVG